MSGEDTPELGGARGFLLPLTLIGLGVGVLLRLVIDGGDDLIENGAARMSLAQFLATFGATAVVLPRRGRWAAGLGAAAAIAAVVALVHWRVFALIEGSPGVDGFVYGFWLAVAGPLSAFLLTVFAKATIDGAAPPRYADVFLAGLTLPLVYAAAALFALLTLGLFLAWAGLLELIGVSLFLDLVQETWFSLPLFSAVGALSVAMIRGRTAVLGALRFLVLFFCRIAAPVIAVFSVTFAVAAAVNGPAPILEQEGVAWFMLSLAVFAMLVFNGVYQNGEGAPPAAWLRLSTIALALLLPLHVGFGAWTIGARIGEYGLTPERFTGAVSAALIGLYALVCIIGAASEIRWKSKRWMAPVAPLNTLFAALWVGVLLSLATPLLDPYAWSARNQAARLRDERVSIETFDFAYLYYRLGPAGRREAEALADLTRHPEIWEIRRRLDVAATAENPFDFRERLAEDRGGEAAYDPAPEPPEEEPEDAFPALGDEPG